MTGHRFRHYEHLRRPEDFRRVYDRRRSASDELIIVYGSENQLPHNRLGLSVGRKLGNAVQRNRHKRLLREAYRLARNRLPVGLDLIVIPRGPRPARLVQLITSLEALTNQVARKIQRDRLPR